MSPVPGSVSSNDHDRSWHAAWRRPLVLGIVVSLLLLLLALLGWREQRLLLVIAAMLAMLWLFLLVAFIGSYRRQASLLRQLEQAQQMAVLGTWRWSIDSETIEWGGESARIFGFPADTKVVPLDEVMRRMHVDDLKAVSAWMESARTAAADELVGLSVEYRVVRDDGSVRWVLAKVEADDQGDARALVGVQQDITSRVVDRERLRLAQEIARIGDWEWDIESGRIQWSDTMYSIYGLDPTAFEPNADNVFEFIHEDDRQVMQGFARKLSETGVRCQAEFRIVRPDGDTRVIHCIGLREIAPGGDVIIRSIQQDVTELVQARDRLVETEQHYRFLFERNPVPMWVFDPGTLRFLAVNEAMLHHYGYDREQLLGMTILDIRPEGERAQVEQIARGPADERPQGHVWTHLHRDGSVLRMAIHTTDFDFEGRTGRLAVAQDVTDREASEQRFQLVARATSDAIYDLEIGSGALWWSDSFYAVFGYSREEVPPTLQAWEALVHPDDLARVNASLGAAIEDPTADEWEQEYRFRRLDGTHAAVIDRGFFVRDEAGVAVRMVGGMLDVTERQRSEERFQLVARATSDAVWDWDLARDVTWRSDNVYPLFGYEPGEIVGTINGWSDLLHPDDRARVETSIFGAIASDAEGWECEYRLRRKDGDYADVLDRGFILRDEAGKAVRAVGGMIDVTQKHRDQADLRLLRRAVESTDNGIVIADARRADLPLVYVNAAFEHMTGYASSEVLGRNCRFLQGVDQDQPALETLRRAIANEREARVVLRNYTKAGALFWNELHLAPVHGEDGSVSHFVGIQNDVSHRHHYEEELAHRATHDQLTGLPNRQLVMDRLQQAVLNAHRYGRQAGVVFIDLDDFKLINDNLDHAAGDEALRIVAGRLRTLVRETDTVGRFGGDEFVVVLTEQTDEAGVAQVIARVSAALSAPMEIGGMAHTITPSMGWARYPEDGGDADTLLKRADMAMYQAKRGGRNRSERYRADLDRHVSQRVQLIAQIRTALEGEEFRLAFQPMYDADGRPRALEALVRWQHPARGLLLPADFIGVCEESGLMLELGRRILREAARHYQLLAASGLGDMRIAVNVSAMQFGPALERDVAAVLAEFSLPPHVLELEITESVVMQHPEAGIETMERIAGMGVCIAIDDFGTGYSSLAYLQRLPLHRIKIDRSFVRDLPHDREATSICGAILQLARSLELATVGEGVETAGQLAWLRANGCDEVQGYLLARPAPFDEILAMLAGSGAAPPA